MARPVSARRGAGNSKVRALCGPVARAGGDQITFSQELSIVDYLRNAHLAARGNDFRRFIIVVRVSRVASSSLGTGYAFHGDLGFAASGDCRWRRVSRIFTRSPGQNGWRWVLQYNTR